MFNNVLYEDNHLLMVEKPINVPVQADNSKDQDLLSILKNYIKIQYNKPGNVYLGLVHRLDRPVGGAIVFAKTSKAASRLSNELRKQKLHRTYLAVIHGVPSKNEGVLHDYLWKDRNKNIVYAVDSQKKDAKESILNYKVIKTINKKTLIQVQLKTGRSHQIRVQFANQNLPLYGDQKYGQNINKHGQQIALWASQLSVKHPTKHEMISVTSTPTGSIWKEFL
ncbi:RluA family pseudouridine synthase [Staphylococcus nepalensis]|uniref:RNA pseudouridylate synthase n=1 Tax=Staphylococcus nepalensis TaxID=214473 RepID=A0A380GK35_9STAP|nr:RluA family pseudouridine synthase [Staphylococcus nepalensis]PNZ92756.1 RNA pseudouridine synthase [Staphylococcus nepalensis]GGB94669.1 RNA pseudouridine synthase [Staphylococcus nepalensis]SUM53945.1 pseudouridylate synthase [Staphylococcus nepalensis]VDG65876.1 pseudouridine synthase [Lacrimispora indolis]